MERENRKKQKIGNNKIYITYTILFCVISFVVFSIFIKNNKGFIWESDGLTQHYAILSDFNQMIRGLFQNGFSMLSWNMGLGLDVIRAIFLLCIRGPICLSEFAISNAMVRNNI